MVFRQGDSGNVMYFVAAGQLEARQYLSLEEARAGGLLVATGQGRCEDHTAESSASPCIATSSEAGPKK